MMVANPGEFPARIGADICSGSRPERPGETPDRPATPRLIRKDQIHARSPDRCRRLYRRNHGPEADRGRARRHRPRHRLLPPRLAVRRPRHPPEGRLQGPARGDRRRPRGASTRWCTSPSSRTTRSARTTPSSPWRSTTRARSASPRRRGRRGSGASSTPPPARPTAPAATRCAPRRATSRRRPPTPGARSSWRRTSARSATRPSPRPSCATPPPTAPARGSASTSCSTTSAASPTPSARSA